MALHVLAYTGSSHDATVDATPVPDDIFTVMNGHFFPPNPLKLFAFYAGGTILNSVQLVTPSTRQISIPRMVPVSLVVAPPTDPNVIDLRMNPLSLNALEEISLLNTLGTNASNLPFVNVLFVGDQLQPPQRGDILTLHGTATTAAVAFGWTSITITWDNTLPSGTYAIVGAQVISATAIAHRFIFKDSVYRPGFLSVGSAGIRTAFDYYRGGMGTLGMFTTTTYPTLQVLCSGTDAAHDVVLSIVKVG